TRLSSPRFPYTTLFRSDGADGDEVDSGLGVGANDVERDAARRLELGATCGELDRLTHFLGAHVVEQDPGRAAGERLAHLRERLRSEEHTSELQSPDHLV